MKVLIYWFYLFTYCNNFQHSIVFLFLIHHLFHLSFNRGGRCGIKNDFTVSSIFLFSAALWNLGNSRPVHSPTLSPHLFFYLLCLLPPFTVHYKMVLVRPDEQETYTDKSIPIQSASLYDGQVFLWSDCLLDLGTDFLVDNMVFVVSRSST